MANATVADTSNKKPSVVDGISIKDILAPKPVIDDFDGNAISIMPMKDEAWISVAEDFETVVQEMRTVIGDTGVWNEMVIVCAIPIIIKRVLPSVTRILSAALNLEEDFVSTVSLEKKSKLLSMVLQAEKVGEILKNGKELLRIINPGETETVNAPTQTTPTTD